ncbi:DUF433 domain-containing protein [Salmonirosea aquatica]|uniref:DUF433 domain-containing protein n=1 Tax=Salmonirosea aquatica TaxID=2654236 RepID=A0A7C9FDX7_9BACT|nr:DUF433 domain-containing protein [Cytophagaceae bacterium SJW1-29]
MKANKNSRRPNTTYSVEDIAIILDLPEAQVKQWMREYKKGQLGTGESEGEPDLAADFHTLIEFYTFYQLRAQGVWPSKINNAREILADMLHTNYPFATASILTDGKSVFYNAELGELIKADQTLQLTIQQVVEPFCKRIEFGDDSLAAKLYPQGRESAIQIDPTRQSGRPVVGDTEVLSQAVFELFLHGNSISTVAERFNITTKEVEDVIVFYEKQSA